MVVMVMGLMTAVPLGTLRVLPLLGAQGLPIPLLRTRGAHREQGQRPLERRAPTRRARGHGGASNQKLESTLAGRATILE
jgi:hypothetical protein